VGTGTSPSFVGESNPLARVVFCSFCGRGSPESGQLISGVDAFICEHCIREWSARLGRTKTTLATSWVSQRHDAVVAGPPPENAEASAADIRAAFAGSGTESESEDGVSVHTVEGGETLGPVLVAAKEQHRGIAPQGATVVTSVDEIVFTDPGHPAVWFSIAVNGTTMLSRRRGEAVVVDGVWKVARSTFCELMALAGVQCLRWPDRRTRHWAQRLEADLEAWAILHRHPVGPEVAGDSVQGSLDDGGDDGGPQRYQFVSRGRSGGHQTACSVLTCDDG
jgi:hypothetical protein